MLGRENELQSLGNVRALTFQTSNGTTASISLSSLLLLHIRLFFIQIHLGLNTPLVLLFNLFLIHHFKN